MPDDATGPLSAGADGKAGSWGMQRSERHAALVEKFSRWVDDILAHEEPPEGVAAELLAVLEDMPLDEPPPACSEYQVWASLTALEQEVKMQGRAFRDVTEAMAPLKARAEQEVTDEQSGLEKAIGALEALRTDIEHTAESAAHEKVWGEVVDLLLDLRDRLGRGTQTLDASIARLRADQEAHRLPRLLPGVRRTVLELFESVSALAQGNALILDRLDDRLARLGIEEIPAEGKVFDSTVMKAVDVEIRDDLPEGTVSVVHQRGYTWRGKVYRLAEVKVTRSLLPESGESD